jgi:hypothetical protein
LLPIWAAGIWAKRHRCHWNRQLHVIWAAAVRDGWDKTTRASRHFTSGEVLKAWEKGFDFGCAIRAGLQGIASIESWEADVFSGFCDAYCTFDGAEAHADPATYRRQDAGWLPITIDGCIHKCKPAFTDPETRGSAYDCFEV